MHFEIPEYLEPNFMELRFIDSPDAATAAVTTKGVAPDNYHATTIFPEYFKINGCWIIARESRMDCVVAINQKGNLNVKEFRNLEIGDEVILGRSEDGREGIYVHTTGFVEKLASDEAFAFRTGRSRETSYSRDYDRLYELLKHEKEKGYTIWVLGPAAVFDSDSRNAMVSLIENGYVDVIFAGNALATHDLEGAMFKTALGQDIYSQHSKINGHYHHIDVINKAREAGSLEKFIEEYDIKDGIIHACIKNKIPFILAGSIRDDGPLPGVVSDVYSAQNAMRNIPKKLLLCWDWQLSCTL